MDFKTYWYVSDISLVCRYLHFKTFLSINKRLREDIRYVCFRVGPFSLDIPVKKYDPRSRGEVMMLLCKK